MEQIHDQNLDYQRSPQFKLLEGINKLNQKNGNALLEAIRDSQVESEAKILAGVGELLKEKFGNTDKLERELKDLQSKLAEVAGERDELRTELSKKNTELFGMTEEQKELDEELKKAKEEIAAINNLGDNLKTENEQLRSEILPLKNNSEIYSQEKNQWSQEREELTSQNNILKLENQQMSQKIEQSGLLLEELNKIADDKEAQRQLLEEQFEIEKNRLVEEITELKKSNEQMKKELGLDLPDIEELVDSFQINYKKK